MTIAVAYFRTSSPTNVGVDKDSLRRQQRAIGEYAARHGITVVEEFYDASVKGSEAVDARPGFSAMIAMMATSGVTMILVENASRFARDLMVQEVGFTYLKRQGFTLIAVDDPDAFTAETPTAVLIRQILGAVAQFEKTATVSKLAGARNRKRELTGRCEGPKQAPAEHRAMAVALRGEGLTLRAVSEQMALVGFLGRSGPYSPSSIACML